MNMQYATVRDSAAMSDEILIARDAGVAALTLNRPEKKNALTDAMYCALTDALRELEADDTVRVILLRGAGGNFSAGNDIAAFGKERPAGRSPAQHFLFALLELQKPLVAAVDGNAVGIGLTLLLHCDLVYASDRASFRAPFVDLALTPEAGSTWLMPSAFGHVRAAEVLMLGQRFDAAHAERLGIINAVLPPDALEAHAQEVCRRLATKAPTALRHTKALMRHQQQALAEHMQRELDQFAEQLRSPDAREAVAAFMEKRAPRFATR
jgi:enoyl-CoA hydratase/carnithine racemase